jgi:hypothetical protein
VTTAALPPFAVFVNPGVSVRFLHALHELGLRPALVVTRNPSTAAQKSGLAGRLKALAITGIQPALRSAPLSGLVPGRVERISNTWAFALQHGWPVLDHGALKTPSFAQRVQSYGCKYAFVFGFSILPPTLIDVFPGGVSGFHPTLLPYARGAVPSVWSALHGHPSAGCTIFRLDAGVDTGNILEQHAVPASPLDDARTHLEHVSAAGARPMAQHALQVLLNDDMPQGVAQTERGPADRRPTAADCALSTDLTLTEVQRRIAAGRWFGGAELTTSAGVLSVVAHLPEVPPPSVPTPIPASRSYLVGLRTSDAGTITLVGYRGTRT